MHTYLTLEEAAEYCRYSVSGFRKIVDRSKQLAAAGLPVEIKYAQARKRGQLRFKREWLDEFLAPKVEVSIPVPPPRRVAIPKLEGFDSRLLNL